MQVILRTSMTAIVACALAACAGNGEGLDANGRPDTGDGGGGGALTPDLASIQANVFTPICAQCHVGAGAPQGLRLDAGNSYGSLVGVPSSEVASLLRVKPGDPDASYLVQKLEGRAAVGARMPLDRPALSSATIAVIRQWILDGAANASTADASSMRVQTMSAAKSVIAVALTRPVDAALVNDATVQLVPTEPGAGSDAPVPLDAMVSPFNDSLILVRPRQALTPGRFSLTLRGTGPAAIADWNAVVIDGDADGTPGGDWNVVIDAGDLP